jgi:N-methylhydantoinase A
VQTLVQRQDRLDFAAINAHLARLEGQAREALRREGLRDDEMRFVRSADMRYYGQAWEVRVDLPPGEVSPATAPVAAERFHQAHEKRYGYSYRAADAGGQPGAARSPRQVVEWVNLRVTGIGPVERPKLRELPPGDGRAERARTGTRSVVFDGAARDCPILDRARLAPGDVVTGPAVVEEYGATTVVFPGQRLEVDRFANLIIARVPA